MPAAGLLPHRPPMVFVDRLLEWEPDAGLVEAVVPAESLIAAPGGFLEPAALVEMVAQACAAIRGYSALRSGGAPARGALVGITGFEFLQRARAGELLRIAIRFTGGIGPFHAAEGEVRRGDAPLARGSLKLWVSE